MTMIADIHTHRPDAVDAVISVNPWEFAPVPGLLYSVGIHPWHLHNATDAHFAMLEAIARRTDVAMIGECGIDKVRSASAIERQIEAVRFHAALSERVCKPLVLHCVRASNELCALRRLLRPRQPWIIHGFRGKAAVAAQLLKAGFYLSYGERFNAESLINTQADRLLAETDESQQSITEIYTHIAECLGKPVEELTSTIRHNINSLLWPLTSGL